MPTGQFKGLDLDQQSLGPQGCTYARARTSRDEMQQNYENKNVYNEGAYETCMFACIFWCRVCVFCPVLLALLSFVDHEPGSRIKGTNAMNGIHNKSSKKCG